MDEKIVDIENVAIALWREWSKNFKYRDWKVDLHETERQSWRDMARVAIDTLRGAAA